MSPLVICELSLPYSIPSIGAKKVALYFQATLRGSEMFNVKMPLKAKMVECSVLNRTFERDLNTVRRLLLAQRTIFVLWYSFAACYAFKVRLSKDVLLLSKQCTVHISLNFSAM